MKHWLFIIIICVLGFLAYWPSLDAEFVYDDNRQIEANQLIQNPEYFKQALWSDVWAFKSDGQTTVSNYWRPTFVTWMVVNFQLVGLNPFYWHVINVLLHFLVAAVLFFLLRSWSLGLGETTATVGLFLLHPVHVESVAWVAGSPDLLFSLFVLSSLLCWQCYIRVDNHQWRHGLLLCGALLFYLLALGAKEVAFLFPPIFVLLAYWQGQVSSKELKLSDQSPNKKLLVMSLLFVGAAVVYFMVRYQVLGFIGKPQSSTMSVSQFFYTLPQVLMFYWQQLIWPLEAAANFSPRLILEPTLMNFIVPLITALLLLLGIVFLSCKSRFQTLGCFIIVASLLPALNLFTFHHEQLVHHRYLYLPILGLLMIFIPVWQSLFGRYQYPINCVVLTVLLLAYTYQSYQFSQIWQDNRTLWQHTTQVDPDSAFNWQQLAYAHNEGEQFAEALMAFEHSINIESTPTNLYGLAKTQHLTGQSELALKTLQQLIEQQHTGIDLFLAFQIYELTAVILTAKNQLVAAENQLLIAIEKMPEYQAVLTDKLAVVLYLQNKKAAALKVLLDVQQSALKATQTDAKMVFFRMAMLFGESNQVDKAKSAFKTFLSETESNADQKYLTYKNMALDYIKKN